jgi:arginine deiminase
VVAANPREQVTLGCNVLAIDDNAVISVAENSDTNQSLRESGIRVVEVSMPNIIKEGGGPRCLTCPTHRD